MRKGLSRRGFRAIAARQLAAVGTVFRQLILQRSDQLLLHCHLLLQNKNQLEQTLSVWSL